MSCRVHDQRRMARRPSLPRPDIRDVRQLPTHDDPRSQVVARSALALIAELDAFFPHEHWVWFARDMEPFFDVARLLEAAGELTAGGRLVEISRASVGHALLPKYLEQELGDRRCVFVDSGMHGNVVFDASRRVDGGICCGMLIYAENPAYPGSHAALAALGGSMAALPFEKRCLLEARIERLPHWDAKATSYEEQASRVTPCRDARGHTLSRRTEVIRFMGALGTAVREEVASGVWQGTLEAVSGLVSFLDAAPSTPTTVAVPLAGLDEPLSDVLSPDAEYALRDLEREARARLASPNVTLVLGTDGASERIVKRAEDLTRRVEDRVGRCVELRALGSEALATHRLNPQQQVAAAWHTVDERRAAEAPAQTAEAHVRRLLGVSNGAAFLRDVLEFTERVAASRRFRADAVGAVWRLWEGITPPRSYRRSGPEAASRPEPLR